MKSHWTRKLKALGACEEAVEWAKNYDTLEAAWSACKRGDWMAWLAGRTSGEPGSLSRRKLSACMADVAEQVLGSFESKHPNDKSPRLAIEAARRGDPDECGNAASSASASSASVAAWARASSAWAASASSAASSAASASSAWAAASASSASVASASSAAAWAAASASSASVAAAWAAAWEAARSTSLAASADIMRRHYPEPPSI